MKHHIRIEQVKFMKHAKCKVLFPELCFTKVGKYYYTMREITPSGKGWQTDPKEYRVVISVTQKKDGKMEASVDYPDGFPVFENCYCPPPPCCKCCKCYKLKCCEFKCCEPCNCGCCECCECRSKKCCCC